MEYPEEHDDIRRSPAAVLPLLVFRAFGPEDVLAAHAYYTTVGECVQGLANALKRLRGLVALEG
jgi:hypothetical protein